MLKVEVCAAFCQYETNTLYFYNDFIASWIVTIIPV